MDRQKIKPDLMVHVRGNTTMEGAHGAHVGTVDKLEGSRYIKLKKADSRDGEHHWIPLSWVERVDSQAIYLNRTEVEFFDGLLNTGPRH